MSENSSKIESQRFKSVLGLEEFQPQTEFVCFLPWMGEFGWYIMNHVKRVHGYNHLKKIVCIKRGHECLFPTASEFYYNWKDVIPDHKKAGVGKPKEKLEERIKEEILAQYGDVTFLSPQDTSWAEKTSLAEYHFVPENKLNYGLKVDVVITPRKRKLDAQRNFQHWQRLVNALIAKGLSVGACGHVNSSYTDIRGLKYRSWDYTDVDSDVEMIKKAKVVVSQESGLAYLTMLCEKPLFIIDIPHYDVANKHRRPGVPYIELLGKKLKERVDLIYRQCHI